MGDAFFGPAVIDTDEWRDAPVRHRYVHGSFEGTNTRFSFYFPPAERYEGRFLHTIEGGVGGNENTATGMMSLGSGVAFAFLCGGYLVESNQGHIGLDLVGDATVLGYRASAESARYARELATEMYGARPHHGYVYGGSGGGLRSILCVENVDDVWDGAVPFVMGPHPSMWRTGMSAVANAQRLLGPKLAAVVDAVEPGGSGDPYAGLTGAQREALAALYRAGFPRGAEAAPQIESFSQALTMWAWDAATLAAFDPGYFDDFWSVPGYMGADGELVHDLLEEKTTVSKVVTAAEMAQYASAPAIGAAVQMGTLAGDPNSVVGIVADGIDPSRLLGSCVTITSGAAAGRERYCIGVLGDVIVTTVISGPLFEGVAVGDEIAIDNRKWLAFCGFHRHQAASQYQESRTYRVDGRPIYPQRPLFPISKMNSVVRAPEFTGRFGGKMIIVQNAVDDYAGTNAAALYASLARDRLGSEADDRFRLWWIDSASHIPGSWGEPSRTTRRIDAQGCVQQAIRDLIAWIEDGIVPASSSSYELGTDSQIILAGSAGARRGIQPVISVRANGGERAEVNVGTAVRLEAVAEVPPGAGNIVRVEWDFDGTGTWQFDDATIDGTSPTARVVTTHVYDRPGTYFPSIRVTSHRTGDTRADDCRIPNLARARVVVH